MPGDPRTRVNTFADIATTILDYFGLKDDIKGTSMLNDIIR